MTDYKDAGVDIEAGNEFVKKIKPYVKSTWDKNVFTDLKSFAGLYKSRGKYLVSGTDGVGTKLKVAFAMNKHDTVGIDLVAMCVNDIITIGAKPLFFLDYIACGSLSKNEKALEDVILGITEGCKIAGCSLLGGETAEMPGMYAKNEYDLAGFVVGEVRKRKIIDGSKIRPGDKLIGLASSGIHSNGYSLVRKIFEEKYETTLCKKCGAVVGEELLKPTKIYVKEIMKVRKKLKGVAHITGGGLIDNIPRVLPKGLGVEIEKSSWPVHEVFERIQNKGNVDEMEMYRTFNMGIGMVLVTGKSFKDSDMRKIEKLGTNVYEIGKVTTTENVKFV